MRMIHALKTEARYFNHVGFGKNQKDFELRFNDRDFKIGDGVVLVEVEDPKPAHIDSPLPLALERFTGRCSFLYQITYIMDDPECRWLQPGVVALRLDSV